MQNFRIAAIPVKPMHGDPAGIESKIQKVSIDTDVWHRVRIGPYTDLDALNRVRTRLRQADIDASLISVGGE